LLCLVWGGLELAEEGGGALLDKGLELYVVDMWEGKVENVAGAWREGREPSVEEDCV
jgi:hypothetical protein